jgi:hypothetical protein
LGASKVCNKLSVEISSFVAGATVGIGAGLIKNASGIQDLDDLKKDYIENSTGSYK